MVIKGKIRTNANQKKTESEQKSLAWKCVACGHTKHFSRPAPAEVAAPCPKCGGEKFAAA
jgi:rubrerythrin